MRTPIDTVHEFVAAFVTAWPTGDASSLGPFFSESATYHNGPLEPACGPEAIMAAFAVMMQLGGEVGVEEVRVVADGPIVMTERVDHWKGDEHTAHLRVAGLVEVHDGLITAWRDYFDLAEFTSQVSPSE